MHDAKRVRHGPARGFALLSAVLLLTTTITTPALGASEMPEGDEPGIEAPDPVPEPEAPETEEPEAEPVETGAPETIQSLETTDEGVESSGSETVIWDGHGSDNVVECEDGQEGYLHWILTPGGPYTLSDGTLTAGDETATGVFQSDEGEHGAMHFYTAYHEGAEDGTLSASVSFTYTANPNVPDPPEPNFVLTISDGCYPPDEPEPQGGLRVNKEVVGEYDGDDFEFRVRCDDEFSDTFSLADGERHFVDRFDAGTICAVEETNSQGADTVTINGSETMSERFTIVSGEVTDVFVVNIFDEEEVNGDTVNITLMKEWFDAEGGRLMQPPGAVFTIDVTIGVEDEVVLILTDEDEGQVTGTLDLLVDDDDNLQPARYGIQEDIEGEGFRVVDCADLTDTEFTNQGLTANGPFSSGTDPHGSFLDVFHLVCNQEVADDNGNGPPPTTPPTPTPTAVDLGLSKVWLDVDGSVLTDPPLVEFEITLAVDGEVVATVDEDTPRAGAWSELDLGTRYVVTESTLPDGWEVTTCPPAVYGPDTGVVAHGVGSFDAEVTGDHVVCNQPIVEVAPIIIEKPEPTPDPTPAPIADPTTEPAPKPVTEVLGVSEELPATGRPADALIWLATALLVAGAAVVAGDRRNRVPGRW